ncbi:hypothetical protein KA025_00670 [Candidatus Saccharibacteria bacterium]|jgi:hypothetical protein|nr:hypothetical protein [Candidatus Saccharibacteria bacterium]MBP7834579.1 hypothetical protein [Candidatus Saccharibacteria bacterium]
MGFDNVKQKVVDVFHQSKETAIDIKNDTESKMPENLDSPKEVFEDTKQVVTEGVKKMDTVAKEVPKKTVQVIDGITARVKV